MYLHEVPCECEMHPSMEHTGIGNRLCQHATPAQARQAQKILLEAIGAFNYQIPMGDLINKPFSELFDRYMREVLAEDYDKLKNNEDLRDVLLLSFLRYASIGFQSLMMEVTIDLNKRPWTGPVPDC